MEGIDVNEKDFCGDFSSLLSFWGCRCCFCKFLTTEQNAVKNKTEQAEDECALEAEGKASNISNQETGKAPENCMDEMKEEIID
ncbi:hypothetical protein ABLO26_11290 [Neobacillus sp. 179-J 1A1 HS]|uniref:hypothetical protein n=1 Tax=Neobacillus driksii TaxID=3035913 RepID=UPI0035BBBD02